MPIISVILSVYNGEKYIAKAIESVLDQTYKNFEFLIMNDASTDSTKEILDFFVQKDQRIKLFTNTSNKGLTFSLNYLLNYVQGNFVARMDADDVSVRDRFEKQINFFLNNPSVLCVGSNIIKINEQGNELKKVTLTNPYLSMLIKKRNRLVHGSMMYCTDSIKKSGGYNETFKFAQDYELLLRLNKQGIIGCVDEFLYKLRSTKNNISTKKLFSQLYFTALAQYIHSPIFTAKHSHLKKLYLLWRLIVVFIFVYKCGLPKIFKTLNLVS